MGRPSMHAVRTKLTAAFLGIIALFSVATLAADRGFRGVRKNLDEIHDQTLPEVFALKEVGIRIPAVLRLQASVPSQRTAVELQRVEVAIGAESQSLTHALKASGEGMGELQPLLASMESNTLSLLAAQRLHLDASLVAEQRLAAFAQEVDEISIALEAELILAARDGRNADSLRDLRVQLFAVLGDMRSYSEIADENELAGAARRYELARRESVRLIASLPPGKRESLAKQVMQLFVGATAPSSLITVQRDVLAASEDVAVRVASGSEIGAKLQRLAGEFVDATALGVESSRFDAQRAAEGSQRIVYVLWVSALLASAGILWLYVRRRVTRPLETLAYDLTRLSEGDLEVEVRSGGDYEIAQVARVAEVFRQNALLLSDTKDHLETKNATLTEFAYVASHDLKSPLRAIANLAGWIHDDAGDVLSAESNEHLRLLHDRVETMETLLEELLRYARLGNDKKLVATLNLGDVGREVVEMLALPKTVEVLFEGTDLEMETIGAPLKLCLRNLIQNAVKYSDQERPTIVISAEAGVGNFLRIGVRDNGPGIPADRREEALRIFRKLDHDGEGVGMGLALCKRAVELIGGSISIESAEPRGALIALSWPVSVPAADR